MAQDWFDDLTKGGKSPSPTALPQRRGGWVDNPYKAREADNDAERIRIQREAEERQQREADDRKHRNEIETSNQKFDNIGSMRKEFAGLQAVKDYRAAIPVLMDALKTPPDAGGDASLIYAYAKTMDPTTGVREAEGESAAATDSRLGAAVANLKKQFGIEGGGQLSPTAREHLKRQMNTRVAQYAKAYGSVRKEYQDLARANGFPPEQVVLGFPGQNFFDEYERLMGDKVHPQPKKNEPVIPGVTNNPGEWKFNDQIQGSPVDGMPKLSADDEAWIAKNARYMSPQGMEQWYKERGQPLPAGNAQKVYDYYAQGGADNPAINYDEKAYRAQLEEANKAQPAPGYTALFQNGFSAGSLPTLAGIGGGIQSSIEGDGFEKGYRFNRDAQRLALENLRKETGVPGALTEATGMLSGSLALNGIGASVAPQAALPGAVRTLASDALFGGVHGANEAAPGQALGGAARGSFIAATGNLIGQGAAAPITAVANSRPIVAASNRVRGMFGRGPSTAPAAVTRAEQSAYDAAEKAGIPDIKARLDEASNLNVPMSLADTHPELRELAAAAVRRSPTAAAHAESVLLPRNRAQIERFGSAIERDLGPLADPLQQAENLRRKAQRDAAPLYEKAYQAPVIGTPEFDAWMATPFGQKSIREARTIAQNERRNPEALGFRLNEDGTVAIDPNINLGLNHQDTLSLTQKPLRQMGYTTQTLDYAKQGMDEVLEKYRNQITNKLDFTTPARLAENNVRSQFLTQMDALNPAYREARAAYAGPMEMRNALFAGKDAVSGSPHAARAVVDRMSPAELEQMRLGYRVQLNDAADKVRYNSNPWDATLGNPQAEEKLGIVYRNQPGVDRLIRQRDLEGGLARTSNDILGNSKTAQRQIADSAFDDGGMGQMALDAGLNLATGQVPIGMMMRGGVARRVKDAWKLGVGKKAVAKADELAPLLFNTDAASGAAILDDIAAKDATFRAFVNEQRKRLARPLGMFGSSLALTAGS